MMHLDSSITVAGIDIGGSRKGCHLVILSGRTIVCNVNSRKASDLAKLCNEHQALVVGIDAPCQWAKLGTGRPAEKAMSRERIFCFSTPTRERAASSSFYGWMFNGEAVYQALAETHPVLDTARYFPESGHVCVETFPHAVTCALLGMDIASAKKKRTQRRQILEDFGIDTQSLTSIDAVDAALCAFTAHCVVSGRTKAYGDAEGGYIVVPELEKIARL